MRVTVKSDAMHECPYADEVDIGTVELTFHVPVGDAPELHDLAATLKGLAGERISHEDYTRLVAEKTGAERAVSRWKTAGLDVTCDLSRESVRT